MYKYNNNILLQSFDGLSNGQSNHNYNTRNKDDYLFYMFQLNTVLNTAKNSPKLEKATSNWMFWVQKAIRIKF